VHPPFQSLSPIIQNRCAMAQPGILTTATISLVEEVDKKILVVLRDGRKLIGTMRSFDQFANVVLENTIERIFVGNKYCERSLGSFVIRGENVVLLGEIDTEHEHQIATERLERVQTSDLMKVYEVEKRKNEDQEKLKRKLQLERGISNEIDDG